MKNKNYTSLSWIEKYSVGNYILDAQHKDIINTCNELYLCIQDKSLESNSNFHEILNKISIYARKHFEFEENILYQCDFPDLEEHKDQHHQFDLTFTNILVDASAGKLEKIKTYELLYDWILNHILIQDMKYKKYLKGRDQII